MGSLAETFDVIVPEPGFGASDTPDWLDTIHDLAYFYLDVLAGLDLAASISSASRSVVDRGARSARHPGSRRSRWSRRRHPREGC
jgi:hypothetical protein